MSSGPRQSAVGSHADSVSICIVGGGVRGLGVLERIVAYARSSASRRSVRVHLVERCNGGPPQFDANQPDYILLNIVCGQASLFPDAASVSGRPPTNGPSLYEWVRGRGLCLDDDGFTVGDRGRAIEPGDFLPRRLYGEYLQSFREFLIEQANSYCEIIEHQASAIDLTNADNRLTVILSDETRIRADYLFLAVGQIPQPSKTGGLDDSRQHITRPYPLPDQLAAVAPGETVAIAGLGLSAVDAILALTFGRGGRLQTRGGVHVYVPSGREPRIVAFSRSGLPYRSRPVLGAPLKYDPIVFHRNSIDALRAERGPKLDYDSDVLPLLLTELRVAYWRAVHAQVHGWDSSEDALNRMRSAFLAGRLESYLDQLDEHADRFDAHTAYFGTIPSGDASPLQDSASYQDWYRTWLSDDVEQAQLGVSRSPLKAALEICREFRDVIRYAVDFGGLTDQSSDKFFSLHAETINRIVVGPQKERTAEVLALIGAGILNVPLGANPTATYDGSSKQWKLRSSLLRAEFETGADWMYSAVTSRLHSLSDDADIIGAMARKGLLKPLRPASSIVHAVAVDRSYHPVSREGADERIWVMGLLCEGVTFYNGYLTSAGKFDRSHYDADRAVGRIFEALQLTSSGN
jgi:uncharacterized NAD(P)/FAD-binding protein YdhS